MKHILILLTTSLVLFASCVNNPPTLDELKLAQIENEKQFTEVLNKHLNAVSNQDLETLRSTLSPSGKMQLILPKTETTNSVQDFVKYHEEWFKAPIEWTFETEVQNISVGYDLGMAVVQVIYREPLRDGKPYFNRMIVSYDLEKVDGKWYFIKDHASSVEKSTD